MNKSIVFAGPVTTRSGYGARSRDICKSLINLGYDLSIISLPWGSTPTDALKSDIPDDVEILKRIVPPASLTKSKPDVFIHCVIPNEFQPLGKYNIGITAGIETDACQPEWIEGCNKMDLVLTSSTHSKHIFQSIKFDRRETETGKAAGQLVCTTPIDVLIEGVDTDVYNYNMSNAKSPYLINEYLNSIPETFLFLFVGHWLQGELGHDRKDVGMLIYTFLKTFMGRKNCLH